MEDQEPFFEDDMMDDAAVEEQICSLKSRYPNLKLRKTSPTLDALKRYTSEQKRACLFAMQEQVRQLHQFKNGDFLVRVISETFYRLTGLDFRESALHQDKLIASGDMIMNDMVGGFGAYGTFTLGIVEEIYGAVSKRMDMESEEEEEDETEDTELN